MRKTQDRSGARPPTGCLLTPPPPGEREKVCALPTAHGHAPQQGVGHPAGRTARGVGRAGCRHVGLTGSGMWMEGDSREEARSPWNPAPRGALPPPAHASPQPSPQGPRSQEGWGCPPPADPTPPGRNSAPARSPGRKRPLPGVAGREPGGSAAGHAGVRGAFRRG